MDVVKPSGVVVNGSIRGKPGTVDFKPFITDRITLDDLVDKGLDTLINHFDTAVTIIVHPYTGVIFAVKPVPLARCSE